jgi:DNA-binding GntR family transcriptional regulator
LDSLSNTISSRVVDGIRMAIINGEFEPGQRLKMSDLIRRFGTSQMPIREALQQLQGEGLVTIKPHRGAQVRTVDHQFINNIYDLRVAIESFLLKKACESSRRDWIDEMKEAQAVYDSMIDDADIPEIIAANNRFHRAHNLVADNQEALDALERTHTLVTVLRVTFGFKKERILQVGVEHHAMLDCLEKGDIDGALKVHFQHCENSKLTMLEAMQETTSLNKAM